ncbi:MAG: trehalose-6-phosphate synthase [Thermomicrobiales bacterium]
MPQTSHATAMHLVGDDESQPNHAKQEKVDEILSTRPWIVVSNRGPVTFRQRKDGTFSARQGSGGLVTAVRSVLHDHDAIWIAAAMTDGDRARDHMAAEVGEAFIKDSPDSRFQLQFVTPTREAYNQYYNEISNPLLWFLQHYLWDTPRYPNITHETWDAWENGYVAVNRMFAEEVCKAATATDTEPIIMLQDYHLYLVGKMIREQRPDAIIQHFIHIPWPDPDYWRLLPLTMRRAICEGLLACDIVGFQTPELTRSFMHTCEANVPDITVDWREKHIIRDGHTTQVRDYPISIDVESVRQTAYSQEARAYERYLPSHWNEYTILRVDRAELSKNIVRGFMAFDRFLEAHPDYQNRVNFIAITQPSRLDVAEYRQYLDDISATAGRINARYANVETGWQPIQIIMGESYPRVLAAMKWYDVLLVNSIIDGMALVAKEGALVNERSGVIVLSEGAGAVQQLGDAALVVSPTDVEGMAEAFYQAITMPIQERQRRAHQLRRAVENDDVSVWFRDQLADIADVCMARDAHTLDDPEPEAVSPA